MKWTIISASGLLGIEIYYSEYDAQYAADMRNSLAPFQEWRVITLL